MPEYPLSLLRPSPRTMRSVGRDDGLDDLAASMRERLARSQPPLIHNLRGCRVSAKKIEIHGLSEAAFEAERDAYEAEPDTAERRLDALDALRKARIYSPDQRAAGVVLVLFSPPGSLVTREGFTRRSGASNEPAASPGPDRANDNAAVPVQTPEPYEDRRAGKPYANAVLRSWPRPGATPSRISSAAISGWRSGSRFTT